MLRAERAAPTLKMADAGLSPVNTQMKILISHASEDLRPAAILRETIERCSLRRIDVWFSSDQSASGGITLGASWFSNLMTRLSETDMIVALLTPNSVSNPWLYFECGFLASKGTTSIVPLALGLPLSDIPMPLSAYQSHDLLGSNSVTVFIQKLFSLAGVPYDEDMTRVVREKASSELAALAADMSRDASTPRSVERADIDVLRQYLDKRFLELHSVFQNRHERSASAEPDLPIMGTSLRFVVWSGNTETRRFSVPAAADSSLQNVLNECWFHMKDLVKPFTYLKSWIVREEETGKKLVVDGINEKSPARHYFDPTKTYRIDLLARPYTPPDTMGAVDDED